MTNPLKLPMTLAAANWLVKQGRDYDSLASWDVEHDGWPNVSIGDPVYVAILPKDLLSVPMGGEAWARSMTRRFDPDERQSWVFVAGLRDEQVWLVHTKRIPTALN